MFESVDKSWDERALEGQSLRKVFFWLLLYAMMLGAWITAMLYHVFRVHHFDWFGALGPLACALIFVRYTLAFYRRLGR